MSKKFDPVLRVAMKKIQEILKKYDIGGTILLNSITHSEYLYHFPPWTAIRFDKDGLRIKSKTEDYDSRDSQEAVLEITVGMVANSRDHFLQSLKLFQDVMDKLEKFIEIDHTPFVGHTPYEE